MNLRFTERAQRAIMYAQEETRRLGHPSVERFHILLGLMRHDASTSHKVLKALKAPMDRWLRDLRRHAGGTQRAPGAEIPFSHSAKEVLERAVSSAQEFRDGHVGTEHLLAGLAASFESDPQARGASLLKRAKVTSTAVLEEIRRLRAPAAPEAPAAEETLEALGGAAPRPTGDSITLKGVACRVRIGVPDWERKRPQPILLDIALRLDLRKAGRTDDVKDTVDYAALERGVRKLAEAIAGLALQSDSRVQSVRVAARKKPKTMPRTGEVAVELFRRRGTKGP